jgi:hypothetical protein
MGRGDYDFFLKDRRRAPSWITAFLPGDAPDPTPEAARDRLEALPLKDIAVPKTRERADALWELEATFAFEEDEPPATFRR